MPKPYPYIHAWCKYTGIGNPDAISAEAKADGAPETALRKHQANGQWATVNQIPSDVVRNMVEEIAKEFK